MTADQSPSTVPLDPNQTFDFTLIDDLGVPLERRSVVRYRYMSCREWITYESKLTAWRASENPTQGALVDVMRPGVVGVSCNGGGAGGTFTHDADVLLDAYSPAGLAVLAMELPQAAMVSEYDRKKSLRQLRSPPAQSAANAGSAANV